MSQTGFPPVIARAARILRDDYARASGRPEQRMRMFREHAQRFVLTVKDLQAFAVEEVRCAYNARLPEGEYRNARGDTFTVDDWGKLSQIRTTFPPQQNLVWTPRCWRTTSEPLLAEYCFSLGDWREGELTPPPTGSFQWCPGRVPAGLEGATRRGVMPPMPHQFQSSCYLQHHPTAAVFDGQDVSFATAAVPQQSFDGGASWDQPIDLSTADQQPARTHAEQQNSPSPAAAEQQPATIAPQGEESLDGDLERSLLEFFDFPN